MAALNVASARFQVTVVVAGAAVLVACTVFAVMGLRDVKAENQAVQRLETEIAMLDKKLADVQRLENRLDSLRRQFDIDRRILPDESEVEQFIESLYRSRAVPGIPAGSVTPERQSTPAGKREQQSFERKSWTLRFIADFFQMAEFINAIESHQRFIQVDGFKVRADKASQLDPLAPPDETVKNDVVLNISTFVYNQPAPKEEAKAK